MNVVVYEPHLRGHRGEYVQHVVEAARVRGLRACHAAKLPDHTFNTQWVVIPDGEANLRTLPAIRQRIRGKVFMLSMRGAPWPTDTWKKRVNRAVFASLSSTRMIDAFGLLWPHWVPTPVGPRWVIDPVPESDKPIDRATLSMTASLDPRARWVVGLGDASDPRKNAKVLAEVARRLPSGWQAVWVGGDRKPPQPLAWIRGPVPERQFSSFVASASVVFAAYTVAHPSGIVARSLDAGVPVVTCVPVPTGSGVEVPTGGVADPSIVAEAIQRAAGLRPSAVLGPRGVDFGHRVLDLLGGSP